MVSWFVGCASDVVLPYNLTGFAHRAAGPVHPLSIAILPLVDDRAREDRSSARAFVYQGLEFEATVLDDLGAAPLDRMTEVVARHLQHEGLFSRIELVRSIEQASGVDLVLDGRVSRFRGYVQSKLDASVASDRGEVDGPTKTRRVLAEVVLSDLRIRRMDGRQPTTSVMECDAGWSIDDRRQVEDRRLGAWDVSAEALRVALDAYSRTLREADLSGRYQVRDRVHLASADPEAARAETAPLEEAMTALGRRTPPGWRFSRADEAGNPPGWRIDRGCIEGQFVALQTLRFHRALGPFVPSVRVWACPAEIEGHYDMHAEFAAQYLGPAPGGTHYFAYSVGSTNWPGAFRELAEHFRALTPPSGGRVLDIVPARSSSAAPTRGTFLGAGSAGSLHSGWVRRGGGVGRAGRGPDREARVEL
ncbi:MAG: hypothetical protein H6729_10785 [Deltaproteobacteria bacterium]|nr:hypothetical protein [Deltaproteobacteria bacterium]